MTTYDYSISTKPTQIHFLSLRSFSKGIDLLRVSLGDHDLSTKNETNNVVVKVRKIIWHLHYSPHININDIALFELEEPVTFNYSISAVKLPFDTG